MRPSDAHSVLNTPAVVITPTTQVVLHTILGATSAMGVVNIEGSQISSKKSNEVEKPST